LRVVLDASGHSELEVAKACHRSSLMAVQCAFISRRNISDSDGLRAVLKVYTDSIEHISFHVRETVVLCVSLLLVNRFHFMDVNERKICRDVFNEGLLDSKPEVQTLAKAGMATYLIMKPMAELDHLATAYIRNCNVLAEREKVRRRKGADQSTIVSEKPDKLYTTTVMMSACMVLAFPYDLPEFVPSLLNALARFFIYSDAYYFRYPLFIFKRNLDMVPLRHSKTL
jgi:hypothetical protein